MRIKKLVMLAALVGALAGGVAVAAGPAAAAPVSAPVSVQCEATSGDVSALCSGGVWPTDQCRSLLNWYLLNGYPDAYCAWHTPLLFGYEELYYW